MYDLTSWAVALDIPDTTNTTVLSGLFRSVVRPTRAGDSLHESRSLLCESNRATGFRENRLFDLYLYLSSLGLFRLGEADL
jgi:hypothetical protein